MSAQQRGQFQSEVVANVPLCREHYRLVLGLPSFPVTEPGQFVQLGCRELEGEIPVACEVEWTEGQRVTTAAPELNGPMAYLRRPFSLAGRRDTPGGVELEFIHRVVGVGTEWLSELAPGDRVDLIGPLGNRFSLPRADESAVLVGGGVGIPPMLYLAEKLAGRQAVAFCGAVTRDLLPLSIRADASGPGPDSFDPSMNVVDFSRHGIASVISTDDGSYGFRGYVTQALEMYLDSIVSARPIIYTCGPELMMKRVAAIASGRGLESQVAVERAMACGMGTCQSCCIRVRKHDPAQPPLPGSDWCWRLACTDGPIFQGADLLW
jgi:dihydroorotate dehydrogenase electron transfer subunit